MEQIVFHKDHANYCERHLTPQDHSVQTDHEDIHHYLVCKIVIQACFI